jgi:hypothetical protein
MGPSACVGEDWLWFRCGDGPVGCSEAAGVYLQKGSAVKLVT